MGEYQGVESQVMLVTQAFNIILVRVECVIVNMMSIRSSSIAALDLAGVPGQRIGPLSGLPSAPLFALANISFHAFAASEG